tara:strand:- start:34 stop:558 length:525 start_codon:yes stop_codon:yes gene_type:complete
MENQTLKKIGFFSRVHGFKGKLVLSVPNEFIKIINLKTTIWIESSGIKSPFKITQIQPLKKGKIILEMLNINHEKAQSLIKKKVFINANDFTAIENPLNKGNFILEYEIYNQENQLIGVISDHIKIKNNELIQTFINGTEVLLPFKKENIIEINHSKKMVKTEIPEGLLDIYLE